MNILFNVENVAHLIVHRLTFLLAVGHLANTISWFYILQWLLDEKRHQLLQVFNNITKIVIEP